MPEYPKLSDLIGRTMRSVENTGEAILFTTVEGDVYELYHDQYCCEYVRVEDVTGNLDDLIGAPLLMADESHNADGPTPGGAESFTWTFYKFGTMKGYVDIRFLGESNGYYSESVSFRKVS